MRLTAEEALDQPWLQRHRHHASPARDSAGRVALHSLALCCIIAAVFSLYFYLLSHYFNIETERFMSRLWPDTPLFSSLYLTRLLSTFVPTSIYSILIPTKKKLPLIPNFIFPASLTFSTVFTKLN